MDIIAELVSDNAEIRKRIRNLTNANGVLVSVATDEEKDSVYKNYYDYKEPVKKDCRSQSACRESWRKRGISQSQR